MLLIDGYNLLFAAGFAPTGHAPGRIEVARDAFVKALAVRLTPDERARALIVFDAKLPALERVDAVRSILRHGLRLRFAVDQPEADDLLERLIHANAASGTLVVSSDHRLRDYARHHRVRSLTSDEFWAELTARQEDAEPDDDPRDPPRTPEEVARWVSRFETAAHPEIAGGEGASPRTPGPVTDEEGPAPADPPPRGTSQGGPSASEEPVEAADADPDPEVGRRLADLAREMLAGGRSAGAAGDGDTLGDEVPPGGPIFPPDYGADLIDDPSWLEDDADPFGGPPPRP